MALRKILGRRLIIDGHRATPTLVTTSKSSLTMIPPDATRRTNFHREYLTSPRNSDFFSLPVGEKLRETIRGINITGNRIRLDGLIRKEEIGDSPNGLSVNDARKLLRASQVEMLKIKLREIPKNCISYSEFLQICVSGCNNHEQGVDFANLLDQSGSVIVLGNNVFLRPDQVVKSMEKLISQSVELPNDPRRKQLDEMEKQKAIIDRKAKNLVQGELYCGLAFVLLQTLGFMRLTFWELSWDVMEPICFFAASIHFAMGYTFFLRTSTEPSFVGYFQRRFTSKQKKLMNIHNFDSEKYSELRKLFYPYSFNGSPISSHPSTAA